jgi:hypothetical protein
MTRPPAAAARLMAALAILKHTYDPSDEVLCERSVENPYYPYFSGEEFFRHRLVFNRSSMSNASAKATPIGPTSSASRSPSLPPSATPGSSPM